MKFKEENVQMILEENAQMQRCKKNRTGKTFGQSFQPSISGYVFHRKKLQFRSVLRVIERS